MRSSSYRSVCLICLIALLFAAIYLARHDPVQMHWMVRCPVHHLSGLKCPGCGTLRAVYSLIHGDLSSALQFNLLSVLMIPLLAIELIFGAIKDRECLLSKKYAHYFISGLGPSILLFTVLRNLFLII